MAWAAPIAVILIIALFLVNLFVQGDPKAKNLPVALIVNDEGAQTERVLTAIEQLSQGAGETVVAFTHAEEADIERLFKEKKYYAALVIPEGLHEALENAAKSGKPAALQIYVNQGYNTTGANYAKTALSTIISQISAQYSAELMERLDGQKIDVSMAPVLVNPIVAEEKIFFEVAPATANGNAPILMAMPAWVGALIGGFILHIAMTNIWKRQLLNREQMLRLMGEQLIFGVIIALISGFTVATLGQIAGINMPGYFLVGAYVSFAAFCFFLLVSAVTAWVGKPAITLFMVIMLLGMGVIMMPREMLPEFFATYIRPWIPIRIAGDGLREIFYFGSGFYTGKSFKILLGIGLAGLFIHFLSIYKPRSSKVIEVKTIKPSA